MTNEAATELETLFQSLKDRLPPTERQRALDRTKSLLQQVIASEDNDKGWQLRLSLTILDQGPNDSRRVVLQCLAAWLSVDGCKLNISEQQALHEAFLQCTNRCIRKSQARAAQSAQLSPSSLRTAASALKATHALLGTSKPSPSEIVPLMDTLLVTMFIGLIQPTAPSYESLSSSSSSRFGTTKAMPSRNSGLNFAALSFQGGFTARTSVSGLKAKSSSSSLASMAAASDGESVGYATDTSTTGGYSESKEVHQQSGSDQSKRNAKQEQRKRNSATRAMRQNSVHCLLSLARQQPRELYNFWGSLFPDSPDGAGRQQLMPLRMRDSGLVSTRRRRPCLITLIDDDPTPSVKLAAIDALAALLQGGQAHLSMAQQRPDKLAAFTSLSAKVGTMIVDLRSHLAILLQNSESTSLVTALLRLTRTFAISTSKARLHVSNATILQPAVFSFCSHKDPEISSLAYDVITALVMHSDGSVTKAQSGSADILPGLVAKLTDNSTARLAKVQVWRTLSACIGSTKVEKIESGLFAQILGLCEETIGEASTEEKLVVAEFISSFFAAAATSPSPVRRLQDLFEQLCIDDAAQIRKVAANAMPHWVSLRDKGQAKHAEEIVLLRRLTSDRDEHVRAEAIRALGIIFNSSNGLRGHLLQYPDVAESLVLEMLEDTSSQVRIRAAWTLANWTEALFGTQPSPKTWLALARAALDAANDDAGVIRARGCLCTIWSLSDDESLELLLSLIGTLCSALDGRVFKNPKLRWNAANALSRAVSNPGLLSSVTPSTLSEILQIFCSGLRAKIFKVKIASAGALLSLQSAPLSPSNLAQISTAVHAANQSLESEIESASFKEASLYAQECRKIVSKLAATFV